MMYIEYRVYCDGAECDANVPSDHGGAVSSAEALNQARIGGWYISGKRHICKGCLDDMTDEDREKLMKNKRRRKASAKLAKGKLNVTNELVRVPDGPNGKRITLVAAEIYATGVEYPGPYRPYTIVRAGSFRFVVIEDSEDLKLYAFLHTIVERASAVHDGHSRYEPRDDDGEDMFVRLIEWKGFASAAEEFASLIEEQGGAR